MVDPGARGGDHGAGMPSAAPPSPADVPRAVFLRGCALLAVSPVSWAASLYVQKPLLRRYAPFSLTAWTFSLGTTAMAALAAALYGHRPEAWRIGRDEAAALLAAVLFGWCAA